MSEIVHHSLVLKMPSAAMQSLNDVQKTKHAAL